MWCEGKGIIRRSGNDHFSILAAMGKLMCKCACTNATISIALAAMLLSTNAFACPEGQSQGAFGWCYPNIGGSVGKSWEHLKKEIPAQVVGNPLAVWLQQSRD